MRLVGWRSREREARNGNRVDEPANQRARPRREGVVVAPETPKIETDESRDTELLDAYSRAVIGVVESVGTAVANIAVSHRSARASREQHAPVPASRSPPTATS